MLPGEAQSDTWQLGGILPEPEVRFLSGLAVLTAGPCASRSLARGAFLFLFGSIFIDGGWREIG